MIIIWVENMIMIAAWCWQRLAKCVPRLSWPGNSIDCTFLTQNSICDHLTKSSHGSPIFFHFFCQHLLPLSISFLTLNSICEHLTKSVQSSLIFFIFLFFYLFLLSIFYFFPHPKSICCYLTKCFLDALVFLILPVPGPIIVYTYQWRTNSQPFGIWTTRFLLVESNIDASS